MTRRWSCDQHSFFAFQSYATFLFLSKNSNIFSTYLETFNAYCLINISQHSSEHDKIFGKGGYTGFGMQQMSSLHKCQQTADIFQKCQQIAVIFKNFKQTGLFFQIYVSWTYAMCPSFTSSTRLGGCQSTLCNLQYSFLYLAGQPILPSYPHLSSKQYWQLNLCHHCMVGPVELE